MSTILKTGIIGAGRIASGFGSPGDEIPLSLAHAVTLADGLELGGFFDTNSDAVLAAEMKWGCPESPRQFGEWLAVGWDVICIATPDARHAEDLERVLHLPRPPRAVLVEKPLCTDFALAEELLAMAQEKGIAVQVNYPRRWHPDLMRLAERIKSGEWGDLRRFRIGCSGGLLHNGSHAIDLLAGWLGDGHSSECTFTGTHLLAGNRNSSGLEILLDGSVQEDCYLWEVVADFALARVSISGIPETLCVETRQAHPDFEGFHGLFTESRTNLENSPLMLYSLQHLAHLANDVPALEKQLATEIDHQRLISLVFGPHSQK